MSLLNKLRASGARTYEASPLWKRTSVLATITVPSPGIDLAEGDYDISVRIKEGDATAYVPVIGDIAIDFVGELTLGEYVAVRDFPDGDVYEGDTSVRAEVLPSA